MPYVLTSDELDRLRAVDSAPLGDYEAPADSPVLRLLASLDREQLAQLVSERRCVPGEVIFQEGEQGNAMYLIWAGRAVVIKGLLHSPAILGYRGPGDVIGEMALLEDQPRSATIIALEPTRLLRVWRDTFQEWLDSTPELGLSIMASLSARLRDADTYRAANVQIERQLVDQMSQLESERQHLLALQQLRQETSDLVIHDLRNPLGTIAGVLAMLEMVLPPEVLATNRDLLDLANSSCTRMQRLVDSLLDVSRLETGETTLSIAPVDLYVLLHEAVNREQLPVRTGRVSLHVAIPDDLPIVTGDAEKLDRVIANLIDNAIKYTPQGGQITIAARVDNSWLEVSVTDAGPGIPPDQRQRIFERFAQVTGEQPRRRGFGLGLAFCRLAVEAHGGQIWVEPGPEGVGSAFKFTLPL